MSERQRRVVAWVTISMDGYTSGPQCPAHDTWLYEHVKREPSAHFEGIWRGASTVLVGRTNYEGFYSVWPEITADPGTDPRTRDLGVFLNTVEKVVVSRTPLSGGRMGELADCPRPGVGSQGPAGRSGPGHPRD